MTADHDHDWARPLYERHIAMLSQLAEAAMEVAVAAKERAVAGEDVEAAALSFTRAARAVRQTILLQSRLIQELEARDRGDAVQRLTRRKDRIGRIVERIARDESEDADDAEDAAMEAAERLEDEGDDSDIFRLPLSEAVAQICKDIGLSPDWPALAQDAWALEELESGKVGWPLADVAASTDGSVPPPPIPGRPLKPTPH